MIFFVHLVIRCRNSEVKLSYLQNSLLEFEQYSHYTREVTMNVMANMQSWLVHEVAGLFMN